MTTDLCTDDVVVHISGPQIISAESPVSTCVVGGGAGVRGGGAGGGAELGRRLLVAARAGDTRAVLDLMAKGAPFTTDWLGTSALHLAAGAGHADTCAVLVRAAVSRDARTKVERTPLHLAAYAGHTAVVELLLDYGAAIDCRDMLRMTPLQWAAARGHVGAATALARRGADLCARDKFGHTARALATRAGHHHVARALHDAARAREAHSSVRALVADQMPEANATDTQMRNFESVQKAVDDTNIKLNKQQQQEKTSIKTEPITEGGEEGAAAQLLRAHGITLLPADDGSTVLNAIQSGRTVVLSDAGKLMLKESDDVSTSKSMPSVSVSTAAGVAGVAGAAVTQKGVVLTATPVKSPPKPGVKVFTLNNKLLLPADKLPVKKIINPQDLQVKFVQLPADSKLMSPVKTVAMKAKAKAARPAVKIIMNKANFNKLIANATTTRLHQPVDTVTVKTSSPSSAEEPSSSGSVPSVSGVSGASVASVASVCNVRDVCSVSAELVSRCGAPALRALLTRSLAELRAARAAIADLRANNAR